MSKKEEERLGKFYEILLSDEKKEKIFLPDNMTEKDLVNYVQKMIELNQPRMLRKENRKPDIKDYKIPVNYFVVESNSVNFNSSRGVMMDAANSDDIMDNLNRIRDDDLGVLIIYHIFKNGRKTLDELVTEMAGYDKMMLTLLINKLHIDGYLRQYKEEDGLETFELVEKDTLPQLAEDKVQIIDEIEKRNTDAEVKGIDESESGKKSWWKRFISQ